MWLVVNLSATLPQEMKLVIPNAQRINRGNMVLSELVETSRSHDFTDIVVLHEHRGEPGAGAGGGGCGAVWTGWMQMRWGGRLLR